ncbi:hypothetical protein DL96DRAFT_1714759 [Flagelloscypha sp. PMI_526]|nr:hypothetical protein DL96DRAFT_1714759 [Flagelloscypha sp. PMI_526]
MSPATTFHIIVVAQSNTTMDTLTELKSIGDLRGKDAIILFGKTRAGKSTFINDTYRKKVVDNKPGIYSDNREISYVNQPIRVDDSELFLVDTIGLGGSEEYHDRLSFTWKWLSIFHPGKHRRTGLEPIVKGILYFIDMMDGPMNESNIRDLETLKALVGEEVGECVVFVTTKWVTTKEQNTRKRLESHFVGWQRKIREDFPESPILRLDDTTGRLDEEDLRELSEAERKRKQREYHNNAMRVLRQVLTNTATQPTLAQREMYAGGKGMKVGQTTLGKTLIQHISEDIERGGFKQLRYAIKRIENTVMIKDFFPTINKRSRAHSSRTAPSNSTMVMMAALSSR